MKPQTTSASDPAPAHTPTARLDAPSVTADRPADPQWGSDVVTDMLRGLGVEYLSLNPGASFRGLHDSIVNYGGNERPTMVLCNHEEVAVAVAHGYAKATGRAMAVGLHTNIGLLHGSMGIFNAFADRVPMLILGGTGPMDSTHRRPGVDWHHTSNGMGSVVRDYTKWEQEPGSVAAIPETLLRAWQLANTEPRGPVYVTLDAGLQEERTDGTTTLPDLTRFPLAPPVAPPANAVAQAARWLTSAQHPVILVGDGGRTQADWDSLVRLAELLSAAVLQDISTMAAFPTDHPLFQAGYGPTRRGEVNAALKGADVVLNLNFRTIAGTLRDAESGRTNHYQNLGEAGGRNGQPSARVIGVSLDHYAVRSWATDFQELAPADLPIAASVEATVPALVEAVERELADHPELRRAADARGAGLRTRRAALEAAWEQRRLERWDMAPLSMERVVGELATALGPDRERVSLARIPNTWASGVWDFRRPLSFLGKDGGGGLGSAMGMAVGAAIGLRDADRPVVAFLGDGDALFAPSALWTAAHYKIPVLFVVANNRSYYNDEEHQAHVARVRGRPVENRWLGMRIDEPAVDFAALARSLGVAAFGCVTDPAELASVYAAAVEKFRAGEPVLVDVRIATR